MTTLFVDKNILFWLMLPLLLLAACETETPDAEPEALVIYSGRGKSLAEPLIERYEAATGREVEVRYGDTAQLAVALTEEGAQTTADLFWAQDAGALGAVQAAGLLTSLPDSLVQRVPAGYRNAAGTWIATSARAHAGLLAGARRYDGPAPQPLRPHRPGLSGARRVGAG